MSIQAVAWALDQEIPPKAARAKLVLISIANHADHTNGYCWLRADTIAAEASCTPRSVFRFVGALIRNGFIRKERNHGEDGKRRANDYWILFNREPAEWNWGRGTDVEDDIEPEDSPESSEDDTTTSSTVSSLPHDTVSHGDPPGENAEVIHTEHVLSHGPYDSRVRWYNAEPSKTKPEKAARATEPPVGRKVSGPPRNYRPPPALATAPQGAASPDREVKPIFVFIGTPAWNAWVAHKKITAGVTWTLTTKANVNGRWCTGWYFPCLFPPAAAKPPPATSDPEVIRAEDDKFMRERGLG